MGKLSALMYGIGTVWLGPSSILLYPGADDPYTMKWSIGNFMVACLFLTIAAFIDLGVLVEELTSALVPVRRGSDAPLGEEALLQGRPAPFLKKLSQNYKRVLISLAMVLGGILFEAGSVLFWPPFEAGAPGVWVFRFGSFSYLAGSLISLPDVLKNIPVLAAVLAYVVGAIAYIVGGVLSEAGASAYWFSSAWLVGSILFAGGGVTLFAVEWWPSSR